MLYRLHFTHCAISKTLLRAKESIYWPNKYSQIVNMVNACETCLTFSNDDRKEPLMSHSIPQNPWEKVGIDLFQLYDKMYLLIVDYLSKYPEVICLPISTTSAHVINVLKQVISRHGIPEEEVTGHYVQFIEVINFNCIAPQFSGPPPVGGKYGWLWSGWHPIGPK